MKNCIRMRIYWTLNQDIIILYFTHIWKVSFMVHLIYVCFFLILGAMRMETCFSLWVLLRKLFSPNFWHGDMTSGFRWIRCQYNLIKIHIHVLEGVGDSQCQWSLFIFFFIVFFVLKIISRHWSFFHVEGWVGALAPWGAHQKFSKIKNWSSCRNTDDYF